MSVGAVGMFLSISSCPLLLLLSLLKALKGFARVLYKKQQCKDLIQLIIRYLLISRTISIGFHANLYLSTFKDWCQSL